MIELACEACGATLEIRGTHPEAWHASCPRRVKTHGHYGPRYLPVTAQPSESEAS